MCLRQIKVGHNYHFTYKPLNSRLHGTNFLPLNRHGVFSLYSVECSGDRKGCGVPWENGWCQHHQSFWCLCQSFWALRCHRKLCRLGRLPLAGTEHTKDFRCHIFARTDAEFHSKETSSSISGQYLQFQPVSCFVHS